MIPNASGKRSRATIMLPMSRRIWPEPYPNIVQAEPLMADRLRDWTGLDLARFDAHPSARALLPSLRLPGRSDPLLLPRPGEQAKIKAGLPQQEERNSGQSKPHAPGRTAQVEPQYNVQRRSHGTYNEQRKPPGAEKSRRHRQSHLPKHQCGQRWNEKVEGRVGVAPFRPSETGPQQDGHVRCGNTHPPRFPPIPLGVGRAA